MKRHAKALVAATFMFVLLSASAALALQSHVPATPPQLDPSAANNGGTPAEVFGPLTGLAVDQSGSDVYVVDSTGAADSSGAVHRFKADGEYVDTVDGAATTSGSLSEPADVAVDSSGGGSDGSFYVADTGHGVVDAFDSTGAPIAAFGDTEGGPDGQLHGLKTGPGSFGYVCGLAVDQTTGNLLVADRGHNRVWVYDSSGAYLGPIADANLTEPCAIATTSGGDFYVTRGDGAVLRFNKASGPEYNYAETLHVPDFETRFPALDVSVNPADEHLYVDQGDRVTEYEAGGTVVSNFGQAELSESRATAVDGTSGRVYATHNNGGTNEVRIFGPLVTLPDATTGGAEDVSGETATLNGTVDGLGTEAQCEFEYGTDETYGSTAPCEPAGPYLSTAAVHADLSGLAPGTTYHYRLHAENADGDSYGADRAFATDGAPIVSSLTISYVEAEEARLKATVNPGGSATSYRFEYVTETEYEANGFANAEGAPSPDGSLPAVNTDQTVVETLAGLQPSTRYRVRLVATNEIDTTISGEKSFKTFPDLQPPQQGQFPGQGFLPDGRAWEMVSPPDKNGGQVHVAPRSTRAAEDCTTDCALSFVSNTAFADAHGTAVLTTYMAVRDPASGSNGWATHGITPPQQPLTVLQLLRGGKTAYLEEFSPDLSTGILRTLTPLTAEPNVAGTHNLYTRTDLLQPGSGSYRLETPSITPLPKWAPGAFFYRAASAGHSADFEHVLYESVENLTGNGSGVPKLYQSDGGIVRLVGLVPSGSATSCGGEGPACVLPSKTSGASIAGLGAIALKVLPRVLSEDGSRANFSAPVTASGQINTSTAASQATNRSQLYQRNSQGTSAVADDTTVKLNVSEKVTPEATHWAAYQTASADGTRVFFMSRARLTDETAAANEPHLYLYDFQQANDETQRLTVSATAGQFRLVLSGEETGDLAFDATPAQVEAALETLPAVAAAGGAVTVTGGPGDALGSSPYSIAFGGGLAGKDLPTMTAPTGTTPLSGGSGVSVTPWSKGGGHLRLIDLDLESADEASAAYGVLGASEDGGRLYFAARSQLVEGEPIVPPAHAGLYLWDEGEIAFVGIIRNTGLTLSQNLVNGQGSGIGWTSSMLPSRITPDGGHLLFAANDGVGLPTASFPDGYDHGDCEGDGCNELYVYDAEQAELQCASCNPSGAAPTSQVRWDMLGEGDSSHQSNSLSTDGRYVFFSSAERLVPTDRNGKLDAYRFDSQTEDVSLISTGADASDSVFLDASADGSDVFFVTKEPLSGWDVDLSYDVYDARVSGGIPEPVPATPSCQGDACQPSPVALNDATPASSSFVGAGDPKRPNGRRCPKGTRRQKARGGRTRCVRKHRAPKRQANNDRRAGR